MNQEHVSRDHGHLPNERAIFSATKLPNGAFDASADHRNHPASTKAAAQTGQPSAALYESPLGNRGRRSEAS